jgi:hypothetical protein
MSTEHGWFITKGGRTRGTRRIGGFERREERGERREERGETRDERGERRGEERRGETHFELDMSGMIQIVISIFDILFISHILPVLWSMTLSHRQERHGSTKSKGIWTYLELQYENHL